MSEEFRLVPGYPEAEVTRSGVIRSSKTKNIRKAFRGYGSKSTWKTGGEKYFRVNLVRVKEDGSKMQKSLKVHRAVALAYVDNSNPADYDQVDHIDGNIDNNCEENLRWCTGKMNVNWAKERREKNDQKPKRS